MERIFAGIMNKALISIGTNDNREENLALCQQLLRERFADIHFSVTSITTPYGENYKENFLNQLAIVQTVSSKEEVAALLKSLEKKIGRTDEDKFCGKVKIDIDLLTWNEEVLKPTDMKRTYVADLLPSLVDIRP